MKLNPIKLLLVDTNRENTEEIWMLSLILNNLCNCLLVDITATKGSRKVFPNKYISSVIYFLTNIIFP